MRGALSYGLTGLAVCAGLTNAIDLDLNSRQSILDASKIVADNIIAAYNATAGKPGGVPGLLPQPYYWWNAGLMFDTLIKYWALSGDDSVVPVITEALLFQTGPDNNYMPPNQSKSLGNDDQATWGLAAMSAAEYGLPNPSTDNVTWEGLAEAVLESQIPRWDETSCGGGLKWQIFTFNNGYNYKNAISQGSFSALAARVGRYTGNYTYREWAGRAVEWTRTIGLLSDNGQIYDGTDDSLNCSEINHIQWTINSGLFLTTGAYSANATAPESANGVYWSDLNELVASSALRIFTYENTSIIFEPACEPSGNCNTDQDAFKGRYVRSLATLRDMAPASDDTVARENITEILRNSATAAAAACIHGESGTACAQKWYDDNSTRPDAIGGINQNLNALEVFLANLPSGEIKIGESSANGTGTGGSAAGGLNPSRGGSPAGSRNSTQGATDSQGPATQTGTGAASGLVISSMLTVVGLLVASLAFV